MNLKIEKQPNVFVAIVSYNGKGLIERCLSSVLKSSISVNIYVVDNNSDDSTREIILENFPQVNLIKLEHNIGFGRANNIVFNEFLKQNGDYLLLLNQDVTIEENTIESLVESYSMHDNVGLISPLHYSNTQQLDTNFSNYLKDAVSADPLSDAILNRLNSVYEVEFVNAAAWLLSKETIKKVGGFNPLFFMYGEDVNYCQRLILTKLKILINTRAKIFHTRENSEVNKKSSEFSRSESYQIQKRKLILQAMDPSKGLYSSLATDFAVRVGRILSNFLTNYGRGSIADIRLISVMPFYVYKFYRYRCKQATGFIEGD